MSVTLIHYDQHVLLVVAFLPQYIAPTTVFAHAGLQLVSFVIISFMLVVLILFLVLA